MHAFGRLLIVAGSLLIILGVLLSTFGRAGLGHLPGDFAVRRGSFTFYLPLMTSVLLSLFLSLLLWLFRR